MKLHFSRFFCIILLFATIAGLQAQSISGIRINEMMVDNQSNVVDEFGDRSAWIELFNTTYSSVNIGGCYLTDDTTNLTKYRISKGYKETIIAPRAYVLVFFSGIPSRGIFHPNFKLKQKGYVALADQGGKNILALAHYDFTGKPADFSMGIYENDPEQQWQEMPEPTPKAINYTVVEKSRAEKYGETDPHGWRITVTAMSIVLLMLAFLATVFTFTGRYFKWSAQKKAGGKASSGALAVVAETPKTVAPTTSDNDMVVIAMTLHLYFDNQHEVEETGFRLNNSSSPWGNKVLNFKKSPIKK